MYDLIIIGKGPAGLSASIYAVRAGLKVLVIGRSHGALEKAEKIENYLGFVSPISGLELLENAEKQAKRLGVEIIQDEVTGVSWAEQFEVHTAANIYTAVSVVLATGIPRRKSTVNGLTNFDGKGVSYCSTCDGFFYRDKNVVVIGNGEYALKEANELKPFASSITLLTNGREFEGNFSDDLIKLDQRKLKSVYGSDEKVGGLEFEDGDKLDIDGIFVAEGTASALDLALKLGLNNDGKIILVDDRQATNLPGIFAAGDCTGGLLQVAVAVGDGARAGVAAASFVKKNRDKKKSDPQETN